MRRGSNNSAFALVPEPPGRTIRYFDVGQGIHRHFALRFPGAENRGENPMCDYSLHAVASRPAKVGERLVSSGFYCISTRGFAAKEELGVAVCLLAGTELAFEHDVKGQCAVVLQLAVIRHELNANVRAEKTSVPATDPEVTA